jgi:hypothetical protein
VTPEDLPLAERRRLTLLLTSSAEHAPLTLVAGGECALFSDEHADGGLLRSGDAVWGVEGVDDDSERTLQALLARQRPFVAWVAGVIAGERTTRVIVDVAEYPEGLSTPEPMQLGVDGKIVADVSEGFLQRSAAMPEVLRWLSDELLLVSAVTDGAYLVVSDPPSRVEHRRLAFRIFGRSIAADVRVQEDGRLQVLRIVRGRRNRAASDRGRTVLLRAAAEFVDIAQATLFGGAMLESLNQLVSEGASYLAFWAEYNRVEERILLRRARAIGWLSYTSHEHLGDGRWRFFVPADEDLASWSFRLHDQEEVELEAGQAPPPELSADPGSPLLDDDEVGAAERRRTQRHTRIFAGRFAGTNLQRRWVDVQGRAEEDERISPPARGVLTLSLVGSRRAVERRRNAERRIARNEAPMGARLRALLEGLPVPEKRVPREQPLTAAAHQALGGTPTARQRDALDVALNTPDIALIQGPPGTGKTAVIAALQAWQNEGTPSADAYCFLACSTMRWNTPHRVRGCSGSLRSKSAIVGGRR